MNRFEEMGAYFVFEANGIKIYAVDSLEVKEVVPLERTFMERFFSLPWRPWVKHRDVTVFASDTAVYLVEENGERKLYAHPARVKQMAIELIIELSKNSVIDS